jgi:nucleotide-binding universal stress UspA family protein
MAITRILVPTDFSVDADAAFRYARELAEVFHAELHLFHVVDDPLAAGMWSADVYTAEIAGLRVNLMQDAEKRVKDAVPPNTKRVSTEVRIGLPFKQIVEAARDWRADLIVMGTHGRTGLAHAVMGSVAERVLRQAPCPVLTLRAAVVGEVAQVA